MNGKQARKMRKQANYNPNNEREYKDHKNPKKSVVVMNEETKKWETKFITPITRINNSKIEYTLLKRLWNS
jgi:hypothetical protein